MKKNLRGRILYRILIGLSLCTSVKAQVDPHFSQYYIQPMTMNPAFTGAFDGDIRLLVYGEASMEIHSSPVAFRQKKQQIKMQTLVSISSIRHPATRPTVLPTAI